MVTVTTPGQLLPRQDLSVHNHLTFRQGSGQRFANSYRAARSASVEMGQGAGGQHGLSERARGRLCGFEVLAVTGGGSV